MNQEDVDRIIAEAVAESKKESLKKWHKGKSSSNNIETARKVLNWTFMVGFVAAVAETEGYAAAEHILTGAHGSGGIYFALPEQRVLFFSIGFGAVALKLIEFYLRFMF